MVLIRDGYLLIRMTLTKEVIEEWSLTMGASINWATVNFSRQISRKKFFSNNYLKKFLISFKIVEDIKYMIRDKKDLTPKAYVNRRFFTQLSSLLKILFPKWFSIEIGYVILVAGGLITRTICDLWLITIATQVERLVKQI